MLVTASPVTSFLGRGPVVQPQGRSLLGDDRTDERTHRRQRGRRRNQDGGGSDGPQSHTRQGREVASAGGGLRVWLPTPEGRH